VGHDLNQVEWLALVGAEVAFGPSGVLLGGELEYGGDLASGLQGADERGGEQEGDWWGVGQKSLAEEAGLGLAESV